MKRIIAYQEQVTAPLQRIHLQLALPKGTECIHAVKATTTGAAIPFSQKDEVGWLWLQVPSLGEVLFAEILRSPKNEADLSFPLLPVSYGFGQGLAWIDGTKEEFFSLSVNHPDRILEGYYTDQLGTGFSGSYTLNIYLIIGL